MSDDEGSIMDAFEEDFDGSHDEMESEDVRRISPSPLNQYFQDDIEDMGIVPDDDNVGPSKEVKFKVLTPEELVNDLLENIKTITQIVQVF